ncbi:MAG: STAS/SEC14 domain-containing protein [Methylosarcina sp.]
MTLQSISGFQKLQTLGELSLEWFVQYRVLIELEDFQEWSREAGWEQSFFYRRTGVEFRRLH